MKYALVLCASLLIAACSNIPVETDYNPQAQFNSYQRYHWRTETSGADTSISPFHAQRVRNRLSTLLQEQRYQEAGPRDSPDFLLRYYITEQVNGYGRGGNSRGSVGLGSGRGGFGMGVSVGFPLGGDHPERKYLIIIDVIDGVSKQLSWRGKATVNADGTPEKVGQSIEEAVSAIWDKYPPRR